MKLTEHQESVITPLIQDIISAKDTPFLKDSLVELSGGAGVGKTFVVAHIIKYFNFLGWSIAITTPTHASLEVAKQLAGKFNSFDEEVIHASTIHSFLSLKIENDYNTGKQILKKDNLNKINNKCDLLIVDEKSMLNRELFEYIEYAIEREEVKCVLLVGDQYQLPAVEGEMPKLDDNHSYILKDIVRQAQDNPLIKLSLDLRKCIEAKKYPKIYKILERHQDVPMFNNINKFLNMYATDTSILESKVVGAFTNNVVNTYNFGIRKALFPNKQFLEQGDYVVLQQPNVIDKGHQTEMLHSNGQTVELFSVNKKSKTLKGKQLTYYRCLDAKNKAIDILDPNSEHDMYQIMQKVANDAKLAKGEFKKELWEEYFSLKNEFIEVKYTYSSTLHKLQGSSFNSVYLDIRDIQNMQGKDGKTDDLLFRLLYVGITRSSDKLSLLVN